MGILRMASPNARVCLVFPRFDGLVLRVSRIELFGCTGCFVPPAPMYAARCGYVAVEGCCGLCPRIMQRAGHVGL